VLVVNLDWVAILRARFLTRRARLDAVVPWQTVCLQVYAAWAWMVALMFPSLFRFA
jgi:hypothetical protein